MCKCVCGAGLLATPPGDSHAQGRGYSLLLPRTGWWPLFSMPRGAASPLRLAACGRWAVPSKFPGISVMGLEVGGSFASSSA